MRYWNGRLPSVKSLMQIYDANTKTTLSKAAALGVRKSMEEASTAMQAMRKADTALEAFGVESLYPDYPSMYYVNMGDPYSTTVLYNSATGNIYVGSWGDYVESHG